MPRIPLTERPLSLGRVDPELLSELRANSRNKIEIANWRASSIGRSNPRILGILSGLTERLIDHVESKGQVLRGIQYEVDTYEAPAGGQQRDTGWHMDGSLDPAIIVADMMPTEFLVTSQHAHDTESSKNLTYNTIVNAYINQDIDAGIFDIYRPDPYECVLMTDHVHRSPYNHTDRAIPRVWMRAILLGAGRTSWNRPQ